jgi:hypothetical protein
VGQIKLIFHKNLSLGDTSNKFGTNIAKNLYFQKSTLAKQKFKMAAVFQDGRLVRCENAFLHAELE